MFSSENQTPRQDTPRVSYGRKVFFLGLQCCVLMLGALVVWMLSDSRDTRNSDVANQIAQEWGRAVKMTGPEACSKADSIVCIAPESFSCEARFNTKSLHRNIYEAEVYDADVKFSGLFTKSGLQSVYGDTVCIVLSVDTKNITELAPLVFGDTTTVWTDDGDKLYAYVDVATMDENIAFSSGFDIRGSKSFFICPIGLKSDISFSGVATNPSFRGISLPDERRVAGRDFSAAWYINGQRVSQTSKSANMVGANFLVGVDRYQKVERSLKYAFIIIFLTYLSVLLTEIVMRRNIPLLNYFLIGVALIIFYTLLLSFSEHMAFGTAYFIASAMTVVLISAYLWRILNSTKAGLIIGLILTVLYVSCFILLILSTYALLLGSLILFIALATMMYGSLHVKARFRY